MKTFIILTALLWYEGIGTVQTDFTSISFSSHEECQEYVFNNKVDLIDGLLEKHRMKNDKVFGMVELRSFELFCETKYILEEEDKEESKYLMEL
jgi:hypothetical protein|tara:strand:+ start:10228 stop:10509 length:282 start_codon:yes stop_codon:yes gene_type:complete